MKFQRASMLEQAFFHDLGAKQLETIREESRKRDQTVALRECSGIEDEALLAHLVELELCPETLSAMTLAPLVAVAWADGGMADKEVEAILDSAEREGVAHGSPAHALLSGWLTHKPGDDLFEAWAAFVRELLEQLTEDERQTLHGNVMGRARAVAAAAGGFLGLARISAKEEAMLDRLDNAFHSS